MYKTLIHEEKEPVCVAKSQLRPSKINTCDVNDLDELITSITTFGGLTPLTISGPDNAGVYEILAGERRYKSVLKINEKMPGFLSEIPCYIVGSKDMPQIIKQLIIEESNLEAREDYNRDTHRFQLLKLYKQLADDGTIEEKEIINRLRESLKLSKRYSGMYMTIFRDGIPELMESVESEKKVKESDEDNVHIPVSIASRIAKLSPDDQKKAIIRINDGENPAKVINDIKKKPPQVAPQVNVPVTETGAAPETPQTNEEVNPAASIITGSNEQESTEAAEPAVPAVTDDKKKPEDDPLWKIAQNGENIDFQNHNVLDYLQRTAKRVDLSIDTAEALNRMKSTEKETSSETDDRKYVAAWIRRIMKKIDSDESLEEEDINIIEQFSMLLDLYNAL